MCTIAGATPEPEEKFFLSLSASSANPPFSSRCSTTVLRVCISSLLDEYFVYLFGFPYIFLLSEVSIQKFKWHLSFLENIYRIYLLLLATCNLIKEEAFLNLSGSCPGMYMYCCAYIYYFLFFVFVDERCS